jgi:hypothetical protein
MSITQTKTHEHQKMIEHVQRGIARLSEKYPDWEYGIQLDKLDMSSVCSCILGQLFPGGFTEGVNGLFGFSWSGSHPVTDEEYCIVASHGFVTSVDYHQLERVWKEVLQQKKAHASEEEL